MEENEINKALALLIGEITENGSGFSISNELFNAAINNTKAFAKLRRFFAFLEEMEKTENGASAPGSASAPEAPALEVMEGGEINIL